MPENTAIPVNLDRALTAVEDALINFDDRDTQYRIPWTPAESLSEKQFDCAIATVAQLRTVLQPALKASITTVTHSAHAPYRSILEYTDGGKATRHIVVAQDFIWDHGTPKACSINYRLAYYLAAALGSAHAPIFANNSFDASVAAYVRCRVQEPEPLNCADIFDELPVREEDSSFESRGMAEVCEEWMKTDPGFPNRPKYCVKTFRDTFEKARSFIVQNVETHGGLTAARRAFLRSELQKVPMSQMEIKTYQDARDGFSDVKRALSALFQTTAGRYYFWELRTQLNLSCNKVTTPAHGAAAHDMETVECKYLGYTARRNFVVTPEKPDDAVTQR